MSNSKLAKEKYTISSNNYSIGRSGRKIEKVTIHHMAGVLSAKQCAAIFKDPSRGASSNYGIGKNGEIALYVDEKNTSYADANWDSNCKSVTIECSNSSTGGNWPISNIALNSLINLVADILKRNKLGKAKLGKTITYHSMYTSTACPGNYLKGKMNYIVKKVNEKLGYDDNPIPEKPIVEDKVLEWQRIINVVYGENLTMDGIFGPDCEEKALKHYLYYKNPIISNEYVLFVQQLFNSKGYNLVEDSMFGPDCQAKTLSFQTKYNITKDGCVGPEVLKLLLA